MFMVLTCLDTFHWLQFDDFTPRKTEQTFVICCKTLDCDNMTGILHSRDGQTLGSSLARFLLLANKFLQSGAHLWHYCQNLPQFVQTNCWAQYKVKGEIPGWAPGGRLRWWTQAGEPWPSAEPSPRLSAPAALGSQRRPGLTASLQNCTHTDLSQHCSCSQRLQRRQIGFRQLNTTKKTAVKHPTIYFLAPLILHWAFRV